MKTYIMTQQTALQILKDTPPDKRSTEKYQAALNMAVNLLADIVTPSAHWIYSGDEDEYDGYYINCSKCGVQRKVYDRDNELDVPSACPHCGAKMNHHEWEVQDCTPYKQEENVLPLYVVQVVHHTSHANRRYTINTRACNEEDAKQRAVKLVAEKWLKWDEIYDSLVAESVQVS